MKKTSLFWLSLIVYFAMSTAAFAAPTVTWTTPSPTTNVSQGTTVVATINDNIKTSTITTSTYFLRSATAGVPTPPANCTSGTAVSATPSSSYTNPTTTVTLTPAAQLASGTGYIACITNSMKNQTNIAVTASSYQFTVRDYIPPTVTAFNPANNSTVATKTPPINVTFSEAMNTGTVNSTSFTLTTDGGATSISGSVSCSTSTFCTFTPDSPLEDYYTYIATVKSTVTDVAGNPLGTDKTWTFSVDSVNPVVNNYSPFPGSNGVAYANVVKPAIIVTFNEVVSTTNLTGSSPTNFTVKQGATSIAGTVTTSDNTTFTFTPTSNLASGSIYTVTIKGTSTGVKDAAGNNLQTNFTWNFTEDYTAPTVASFTPTPSGTTNIGITTPITVTFTEAVGMSSISINNTTFTVTSGTDNEIGVITYDATAKKATFAPAGGLAFGTTYTVTLTSGIKDLAGNALAATPYTWTFTTQPVVMANYSIVPPFISAPVTPNVLIILDNSQSMDEDMQGNAVGSPKCGDYSDPNTCSRSIIARKAMIDIVKKYANTIRIGLMSYKLPSVSSNELHNAFYFASYDPKSYCPNMPAECYNYCVNEDPQTGVHTPSANEAACQSGCVGPPGNAVFDVTYRDPILTTRGTATGSNPDNGTPIGSDKRKSYCKILYPKTMSYYDGTATIYHNLAGTFYDGSNQGTRYLFSTGYSSTEYPAQTDSYNEYTTKTGTSDGNSDYSGSLGSGSFQPTDDDWALGFYDFGKRMYWTHTSKTWFANTSPGGGYLQVPAQDNVSDAQLNALKAKLRGDITPYAFQNDETGYMSCTNTSNPNQCSYILNAGLTPTAGTLQSAQDYLNGGLATGNGGPSSNPKTPIQYTCQKNFVIYVTDGLPSVSTTGTANSTANLMPDVLAKIDALRCPANPTSANCKVVNGTNNYDVKTYVLGMALSGGATTSLDSMAVHGGTDQTGHAYYANTATELSNAFITIFDNILTTVSSGSAASIVNNRGQSGANIITAVFYPTKDFNNGTQKASWIGDLQNFWYYFDPYLANSTIREDTVNDNILDLTQDDMINIRFDTTTGKTVADRYKDDGKGNYTAENPLSKDLDHLSALWRAGSLLHARDLTASPRTIYTSVNGTSFVKSDGSFLETDSTLVSAVTPYLDVSNSTTQAQRIIKYIRGFDDTTDPTLRSRTVTVSGVTNNASKGIGVWKLGDVISSTPRILSDSPLSGYHLDYGDNSYKTFISTNDYKNRGMVYVGANDGMLHAFRLGKLTPLYTGAQKVQLTNPGTEPLGSEAWAFIPEHALPYLKYYLDPNYSHMYYVDDTSILVDASINVPTGCAESNYWNCVRKTTTDASNNVDLTQTSWRTILIGGMGLGGASRAADGDCTAISGTLPDTLLNCVKAPINSTGYTQEGISSYFALDVTTPESPSMMWHFSDPTLGYSAVDPVIVRINGQKGGAGPGNTDADPTKNGRWFAVFASGPTGPIETTTHQFYGRSDQNMKIFVVDLKTGVLAKTFDSLIPNSFAGSLANNAIDFDKGNKNSSSFYTTDVVYIGYVKPRVVSGVTTWTSGGLMRLVTNGDTDPTKWTLSKVIDNTGPVTAAIDKMTDDMDSLSNKSVQWLYFGTGRYFFKNSAAGIDSASDQMTLFGIKDPCYNSSSLYPKQIDPNCTTKLNDPFGGASTLVNQSSDTTFTALTSGKDGWFINLDSTSADFEAERVITTPEVKTNGLLLFTTFKPTSNICGFGGETFFWLLDYSNGGSPSAGMLKGKVLVQLSTGAIVIVDLSQIINGNYYPPTGGPPIPLGRGNRQIDVGVGKPPGPPPPADSLKKPIKKILQIQEK